MYITFFIRDSDNSKLSQAAKRACNFWNNFVIPDSPLVIRLDLFTPINPWSNTTGTSSAPVLQDGLRYSRVRLNRRLIKNWSEDQIAGTIAHEIGHSLGFGWAKWNALYNKSNGQFLPHAVAQVPALADMQVELDDDEPQKFYHWDEGAFGDELMTPYKDNLPYVLPVTIDVMSLLGHQLRNKLLKPTPLADLLSLPSQLPIVEAANLNALKIAEDFDAPEFETLPI